MKTNKFIPYDQISRLKLNKIASAIANIPEDDYYKLTIQNFKEFHNNFKIKKPFPNISLSKGQLLDIPNTFILVEFSDDPFCGDDEGNRTGWTSLLPPDFLVPVIYIFIDGNGTLEHEKIHACQLLSGQGYPFTPEEYKLFLTFDLLDAASHLLNIKEKKQATNFYINVICYRMWMELEAVYHAQEQEYSECLMHAFLNVSPFEEFLKIGKLLEWNGPELIKYLKRFTSFCNRMGTEVKWLGSLRKGIPHSLGHDMVLLQQVMIEEKIGDWFKLLELTQYKNIDFEALISQRKVGRNEPCPCGSGKKYKKCCGDSHALN